MLKKCSHQWQHIQSTYNPPSRDLREVNGANEDLANKILFGITNIKQTCTKCNKIDVIQVIGKV